KMVEMKCSENLIKTLINEKPYSPDKIRRHWIENLYNPNNDLAETTTPTPNLSSPSTELSDNNIRHLPPLPVKNRIPNIPNIDDVPLILPPIIERNSTNNHNQTLPSIKALGIINNPQNVPNVPHVSPNVSQNIPRNIPQNFSQYFPQHSPSIISQTTQRVRSISNYSHHRNFHHPYFNHHRRLPALNQIP
ncbi:16515_t:CDS:2, partial [Funneliformis geosporum]